MKKYNIVLKKAPRRSARLLNASINENRNQQREQRKASPIKSNSIPIRNDSNRPRMEIYKRRYSVVDPIRSEYVVEEIKSVTIHKNILRYEVKWLYWDDSHNTFEPLMNLNCLNALNSFIENSSMLFKSEIEALIKELAVGPLFTENALKELISKDVSYDNIKLQSYLISFIHNPRAKQSPVLLPKVQDLLQKKIYLDKRNAQMAALKEWENKMNEVDVKGKLRVINNVDFEGPPLNFTYIHNNISGRNIKISTNPNIGCTCVPCGFKTNCCGKIHGSEYAYFAEKRLKHTGIYIFECNKKCKCGPECSNRLVQKGRTNKLCIFRTSNGCGWGVKTDRHIRAGDFVCEYVGEIIKSDEAEQRGQMYDKMGVTYLFDLDQINPTSEAYTVDAYRYGNISHFINHSCEPNLCVVNVWIDCLDPNLSRLALFALEDIEQGQEVTIDYKFSANVPIEENVISADNLYNNDIDPKFKKSLYDVFDKVDILNKNYKDLPDAQIALSNSNPTEDALSTNSKYMLCKCGARSCRKILRYY